MAHIAKSEFSDAVQRSVDELGENTRPTDQRTSCALLWTSDERLCTRLRSRLDEGHAESTPTHARTSSQTQSRDALDAWGLPCGNHSHRRTLKNLLLRRHLTFSMANETVRIQCTAKILQSFEDALEELEPRCKSFRRTFGLGPWPEYDRPSLTPTHIWCSTPDG
ncbi:hypothetical protein L227DRAFT_88094 [Lentinus tigrinus ALCF2SS1-6]|uniref:Uncharacterized protein n=1 Tax=Lentinus tigrinus ALCF2SS1-6 TaxID=1328759 RepID=A0A5C2S9G7_9APHY|nr:hypothetical protein L227DRAFT_88094 [Lentinus tigrinus ALCF2SS1-6]